MTVLEALMPLAVLFAAGGAVVILLQRSKKQDRKVELPKDILAGLIVDLEDRNDDY